MRLFCLYAYKESSEDYCKGCHMASYSSNFIRREGVTEEELIGTLVEIINVNKNLGMGESGYDMAEISIFMSDSSEDVESASYRLLPMLGEGDTVQSLGFKAAEIVAAEVERIEESRRQAAIQLKEEQERKRRIAELKKVNDEKALFEDLKKKYGNPQ